MVCGIQKRAFGLEARPRWLDRIPHDSTLTFDLPPVHSLAVCNVEPLHVWTAKNHTGETLSVRLINPKFLGRSDSILLIF